MEVKVGRRKGLECGGGECVRGCGGARVAGGDAFVEDICEARRLGWGVSVVLRVVVVGGGRGGVEFADFGGGRG